MLKSRRFIVGLSLALVVLALIAALVLIVASGQPVAQAAPAAQATATPKNQGDSDSERYFTTFSNALASRTGISQDKLNAAFAGAISDTVDQLVKDGKLTQQDATQIKNETKDGYRNILLPLIKNTLANSQGKNGLSKDYLMKALEAVAPLFNLLASELQDKLKAGDSLADLAKAHNVTVDKVKETMLNAIRTQLEADVKAGKLTQAEADEALKEAPNMIAKFVDFQAGDKGGDWTNPKMMLGGAIDEAAKLFNLNGKQLMERLQTQSLAAFAQSQNVPVQKVKDNMLNSYKTQLDNAVSKGKLSQSQADELYRGAPQFLDDFINSLPNPDGSRRKA